MQVKLTTGEIELIVAALEALHDQAVIIEHKDPNEQAEHIIFTDAIADLSAKLSKLV